MHIIWYKVPATGEWRWVEAFTAEAAADVRLALKASGFSVAAATKP